ncbi:MAG: amino acid adenylation domain-containing protein [Deltaproteobacteria bacterium]|nr:amino acid adenylation domain-containing protein [Deltaproteobacteria bacterium]
MTTDNRAERLRRAIEKKRAAKGKGAKSSPRPSDLPPRPAGEAAHLGEMQRSLWLAHQVDPDSSAYNLASGFRVQGELHLGKLQQAFDQLVARHRLLRSTFRAEAGSVLQIEHSPSPLAIERIVASDGGHLEAAIRQARLPFDLSTGPLVRLLLVEQGGDEEVAKEDPLLILVLHHILADERSLGILWQELAAGYNGEATTSGAPGPRVDLQYDDYVHWQRAHRQRVHLQSQRGEEVVSKELDFWRHRLDPLPENLQLAFETRSVEARVLEEAAAQEHSSAGPRVKADPVVERRPGEKSPGRLLRQVMSPSVKEGIRRLAVDTGTTPFAIYAFAFRLLLHRYSEGRPIAFATPVSTRTQVATAGMVGYFSNPVVISTSLDEDQAVAPGIGNFSGEVREVLAHASLSFQRLVEELAPPRSPGRHPLFQAMFVYQEYQPLPRLGAARLDPVVLDLGASKFDLTLFLAEGDGDGEVAVEYRVDRFRRGWMEALLRHYGNLLEQLPERSKGAIAEISLLGPQEQQHLIAQSRGSDLKSDGTQIEGGFLPQLIFDRIRQLPDSPAVVCGGVHWSYGDLGRAAGALSQELAAVGVGSGDRVGIFLQRSAEMIAAIVGTHWAGGAYVPLDPTYPEGRNRLVLEDAEVAAVITTGELQGRLPAGPWSVIAVDSLGDSSGDEPYSGKPVDLSSDAPAYLLYTSGSTGRPKGVVISHDNLRASTGARSPVYEAALDRFLLIPSIAFDSSVAGIFWTLAAAKTLVVPVDEEARDPRRLAGLVAEERVSGLLCVPSLYGELLRGEGGLLEGLETVIVAGEACSSSLVESHFRVLPGVRLFNEYGPTEGTVWATVHEMTPLDSHRPVAIGQPIPGVQVDVLDSLGRRVPAGVPGQLWIEGPTVAQGYWRQEGLTQERFQEAGGADQRRRRFGTGDRVLWELDGRLLFLGRTDEQISLRGFRIEPGEVEAALMESAVIEEAAVVARTPQGGNANGETQLVAFVRVSDGGSGREADGLIQPSKGLQDLASTLADRLPAHMIPSRLVELPELPTLPNGKVDREALREHPLDHGEEVSGFGRDGAGPGDSPRTLQEQGLISLWEGLLGRSGLSVKDNFFLLGGHSLLVVEMTLAIERDFEVTLSANEVFENPTVEELARYIEEKAESPGGRKGAAYQHLFPIQPSGDGIPFIIAVPHFFSAMFAARFRGQRPVYGLRGVSLRPEGNRGRWRTMKDLGQELMEEIRRRFPNQPVIIAGYSFGASMAVEAVRVMEEQGLPVHSLYLIAPMPIDLYRFGPFRIPLDRLPGPKKDLTGWQALRLFLQGNNLLTRPFYARLRFWLTVQPWRWLLCLVGEIRGWLGLPLTPQILHADVRLERFRLHSRYRPEVIRTPTIIFDAPEAQNDASAGANPTSGPSPSPSPQAAATWRPYFEGPFTIQETPDPHLGEASAEAARKVILRHLKDLEAP